MNNWDTAVDATTTALNSQGSAVRENQAYMDSYEAKINKMKNSFTELSQSIGNAFLKSGLNLAIPALEGITRSVIKLVDTVGLLPAVLGTAFAVFSMTKSGKGMFDGITLGIKAVMADSQNMGTVVTNSVSKMKNAYIGLGGIVGKALITGGMALAIAGIGWAVEKLINHFAKIKKEADDLKKTNDTMVESFRNSGSSLTDMVNKYDELYNKYGDFHDAVASGKIDARINVKDYEEYENIVNELTNKLPTVIEYTDAQGVSHLKASKAVREQLEYAKELSKTQAELELQAIGEKMAKEAEKAKKAFEGLLEVQNKIKDLDINGQVAKTFSNDKETPLIAKLGKSIMGMYDGANFADTVMGLGKVMDKKAEMAVNDASEARLRQQYLMEEVNARAKVQSSIVDQLSVVKEYATAYMEANGHVENLGATSKAVIQEFSQMNSGYLDAVVGMDLSTDDKTEELTRRANNLMDASAQLSDVFNSAYEQGLGDLKLDGTLAQNKQVIEDYGASFESMISMIPKSMITVDDATGKLSSSVIDLAGNFKGLSGVSDGIADKTLTYSQARLALGELGITGQDADQMIRNFGQSAGNAEIQAGLLATTVDESAEAMSDLKTATLETVDALSEITGVSEGNKGALDSYITGIEQSKTAFGDAYESSELYGKSIAGMATYFGMSEEGVKNNMSSIILYEEALGALTSTTDDNGVTTLAVGEMTAEASELYNTATERMKENGLNLETNMQMVLGLIPDISEAFKSVNDIDFSNVENETSKLATSFLTAKEGSDEYKEAVLALGDAYPDLHPIRDMLSSFYGQIKEGEKNWGDLELALQGELKPAEISALIAKMKEIEEAETGVKNSHDETKEKLAEPLVVEVKPLGVAETKQRMEDLGLQAGSLDGTESTLHMFSDTNLAQEGINELSQMALDLEGNETEIKVRLDGATTAQEQAVVLAGYITELSGEGQSTSEVLEGLGANTNLEPMNGQIDGAKTKLESMNTAVSESQSNILAQVEGLNGAFNDLDLGIGKVEGLKDILGSLSTATNNAKNDVTTATGLINVELLGVAGIADGAIVGMANLVKAFQDVATGADGAGLKLTNFRTSTLGISLNVIAIANSATQARASLIGYAGALGTAMNSNNQATFASIRFVSAKLNEARAMMVARQSLIGAGQAYGIMTSAVNQAVARVNGGNLVLGRSIIALATVYKNQTGNIGKAMNTASSTVSSRTSSMNSMHNSQISRLKQLGQSAVDAKQKISSLNSAFSSTMSSMANFIARAQNTARQATKTQSAVQNMKNATSGGIVGAISGVLFGSGINDIVNAIKEDSGSPTVNLGVLHGENISGGVLSANAGESTSLSGAGGTSGTINLSSYNNQSGQMVFSASATEKEKHEDAYKIDGFARQHDALAEAMSKVEGSIKRVSEESSRYRGYLQDVMNLESKRLGLINKQLSEEKQRKLNIEKQLKTLPAINKQTVAQRKYYNELQKQYDDTLGSISSLTKTQQDLTNSAIENQRKQFQSLIDEIVSSYDKAISIVKEKLEGIDFKIDLLAYTDPDDVAKKTQLLVQKQTELMKQESHLRNMEKALTAQYNSAKSKYGANDERTLSVKKELDDATSDLRSATLQVKKAEKEIKDIRADVAKDGISKLKDYYGNMKSMASEAIKAEQKALEESFKKREKLYDKEISKIEEVYSAKIKSMDDEEKKNEYQENMSELEANRVDIERQLASASRDTSLQGKKHLKELQESLAETNKAISEAQKARQKELLKEQLEAEKEAQIKAIEDAKKLDEEKVNLEVEGLDKKAKESDKYYSDLLDNDKFWDTMQDDVVNGKFGGLISELDNMYKNIGNMNNGVFDGLLKEFSSFSDEAKKEFKELNEALLKNMKHSGGTNSSTVAKDLAGVGTGTGNTSQNAIGTPSWMTGNGTYSAQNVLTSSGTAPAPPKPPAGSNKPAPKPVVGGTYEVKKDVGAYYTSDDAKAYRSKRGTVKKGTYWIYNIWNNMINVTNKKGAMGSWINPAENKGGVTASGSMVAKSVSGEEAKVVNDSSGATGTNIALGSLSSGLMSMNNMSASSDGDSSSMNGAGGTSGLFKASSEAVGRIIEQARSVMPKMNIGSIKDAMGSMAIINGGDTSYNTEINIENMSGKKKDADNLLGIIDNNMRRIGK